ncbi:MAG: hypothetical protein K2K14_05420, partial [Ruminococcus sp.]|nr:hypothetical protein [Ruminococcus sp.]
LKSNSDYINWNIIEEHLCFKLHENAKKFYSHIIKEHNSHHIIKFRTKAIIADDFIKSYENPDFINWLADFELNDIELYNIIQNDEQYLCNFFDERFYGWTGGNNFGKRMCIGSFYTDIGDVLIIFNNDTGKFEFNDCGYGYFPKYEDNPWGIIADNTDEFFDGLIT